MIKLRLYKEDDERAVLALWLRTWNATLPHIVFSRRFTWFRWYWKAKLVPKTRITVAEIGETIVGFFTLDLATGYLDQLAVVPEQWGKGVSERLLAEAKRLSPHGIELRVNSENVRAIRFYQKQGFIKIGELPNRSDPPIYVMQWHS